MSEINTDLLSALKGLMETLVGDEFADDIPAVVKARAIIAKVEGSALDGGRPLPYDRDTLGRFVREAWVRWAETQPSPKPSWLAPYDELSEPDKEADRQIGEALARWALIGESARLSKVEEHLRNIEATANAISSPQRMSIIRKQALLALAVLGQAPTPIKTEVANEKP